MRGLEKQLVKTLVMVTALVVTEMVRRAAAVVMVTGALRSRYWEKIW